MPSLNILLAVVLNKSYIMFKILYKSVHIFIMYTKLLIQQKYGA